MPRKKIYTNNFILCLIITLAMLAAMVFEFYPLQFLEYKVYDRMSHLRNRTGQNSIIIVSIDNESLRSIGGWPWPRSYIADMVRKLSEYGTHTLGLALMYPDKDLNAGLLEIQNLRESQKETPLAKNQKIKRKLDGILAEIEERIDHDRQLISAVRSARNVVLPLHFLTASRDNGNSAKVSGWLWMNSLEIAASTEAKSPSMEAQSPAWKRRRLARMRWLPAGPAQQRLPNSLVNRQSPPIS